MENKIKQIIIAKDGYPLEQIIGKPITNFFRRLFLSDHIECRDCYERRISKKEIKSNTSYSSINK
jgi:hypothetical protein